ncbi:universal stress protein [Maritimibacter sp. 55A14]|uniref:universal stress protein n=1 Tax=Maritimibacter sp. 55A14 TaxID=2174844 RepID=UPI000D60DDAE|nr:universal stress protein [Maritimibacter sp. 55A14]PWE32270.1 universal stress protein [Maritimibacter sp. 55A14]
MAFKTILTVTLGDAVDTDALDAAVALTRREEGHLDILCLGVDRVQVGYYFDTASPALLEQGISQAREVAHAAKAKIEERLEGEDIAWSVRAAVVQIGAIAEVVGRTARYCDLVVLPKPYGKEDGETEAAAVLEASLFEGRAPVLVVPGALAGEIGRKVVVGWNESTESLAAVRAALPVLQAADSVDVAIIDPEAHAADRSDPGADLCRMLSRHGVAVEASVLAKTMPRVCDVLMRHATDEEADLIVMGAYGHSRFREAILGGATRDMLADATVPVLMAH